MPISIYCAICKNFIKDMTCKAFPDGIPEEIFTGVKEHNEVVNGQVGEYVHEQKEGVL